MSAFRVHAGPRSALHRSATAVGLKQGFIRMGQMWRQFDQAMVLCVHIYQNSASLSSTANKRFLRTSGFPTVQSLSASVPSSSLRFRTSLVHLSQAQMASTCASIIAPVASAKVASPAKTTSFNGLARMPFNKVQKNSFAQRTVSNGIKTRQMMVWQPTNNKWALWLLRCDFTTMASA